MELKFKKAIDRINEISEDQVEDRLDEAMIQLEKLQEEYEKVVELSEYRYKGLKSTIKTMKEFGITGVGLMGDSEDDLSVEIEGHGVLPIKYLTAFCNNAIEIKD